MTDDWLDTGHGADASRLSTVFSRTSANVGGARAATSRPRLPRSAGPVSVSVLVAAVMLVGSAGAVYAIRESLFPSLGAETSPSVWQNPAPPDAIQAPSNPSLATTTTSTTTTVPSDAVSNPVSSTVSTTVSSTVSTTSIPAVARATPTSTVGDHDSGGSGASADDPGSDNSGRSADDLGSDGSGSDRSGSGSVDTSGRDEVRGGSDDDVDDDAHDAGSDPDVDAEDD